MAQAVVSVCLNSDESSLMGLIPKYVLEAYLLRVMSILSYTALLIRNTKENRVDVCCFLTARYTFHLLPKQLPACILRMNSP